MGLGPVTYWGWGLGVGVRACKVLGLVVRGWCIGLVVAPFGCRGLGSTFGFGV